jgi:hypothetical protein
MKEQNLYVEWCFKFLMLVLMQDVGILVGSQKERCEVKVALSNSFGFGGHNSSILFAPFKELPSSSSSK